MNDRDTAMQNPLYEKLSRRFSYSGKTVGEMMLSRAASYTGHADAHEDLHSLTSESLIVRANHLPRPAGKNHRATACGAASLSLHRISPSSLMALVLSFVILTYVFFAGLHHNTPLIATPDFLESKAYAAELYAPAADIDETL